MPSIVTASELRTILGVSSSLYSDAYLTDIVDASENLVLPMLVTFQSKIDKVELKQNVAYFHTATIHEFTEGQSVVITSVGAPFNGTHTVTNDLITPYVFTAAITNADVLEKTLSQPETLRSLASQRMWEMPMSKLQFWLFLSKSFKPEPLPVDPLKESISQ